MKFEALNFESKVIWLTSETDIIKTWVTTGYYVYMDWKEVKHPAGKQEILKTISIQKRRIKKEINNDPNCKIFVI